MNNEPYRLILKLPCPMCRELMGRTFDGEPMVLCPACNGTHYRLPTNAEIDEFFAVEGMGWTITRHGEWRMPDGQIWDRCSNWHPREDPAQALMLVPGKLWSSKTFSLGDSKTFPEAMCLARAKSIVAREGK